MPNNHSSTPQICTILPNIQITKIWGRIMQILWNNVRLCVILRKNGLYFSEQFQVLMLACLPYLLSWILLYQASSIWWIYSSRILVGIGHALITTTVYTVEVASKDLRGSLSLFEAALR